MCDIDDFFLFNNIRIYTEWTQKKLSPDDAYKTKE